MEGRVRKQTRDGGEGRLSAGFGGGANTPWLFLTHAGKNWGSLCARARALVRAQPSKVLWPQAQRLKKARLTDRRPLQASFLLPRGGACFATGPGSILIQHTDYARGLVSSTKIRPLAAAIGRPMGRSSMKAKPMHHPVGRPFPSPPASSHVAAPVVEAIVSVKKQYIDNDTPPRRRIQLANPVHRVLQSGGSPVVRQEAIPPACPSQSGSCLYWLRAAPSNTLTRL